MTLGGMGLREMPLSHLAAVFALLAIVLACFLGIVGLRFRRRGAARFWMAPATTALVLFPVAFAAAVSTVLFMQALSGMALIGAGGVAALAGASAESLLLLFLGLGSGAMLAFVGVLMTAVGSSRAQGGASGGGLALHGGAVFALALAAGVVVLVLGMIDGLIASLRDPAPTLTRLQLSLVGSVGLALVLCALTVATALRAPRSPSPWSVIVLSMSVLSLSGLGALTGVWAVYGTMERLSQAALRGQALDAGTASPRPGVEAPAAAEPGRVGGAIKEPRKLKNVSPVYPDAAREARVQGVVVLECIIDREGRVTRVEVPRGIPLLDAAAVEAVEQWVYAPTLLNGVPVPVIMTVTVSFTLS